MTPASGALLRAVVAASFAGTACMIVELAAVRLLAPHFGDSAYVWTNVIGIMLAALAAGAWLGGRIAARADAAAWPTRLLVGAGALVAVAPFVARPLGSFLLPPDLPLDAAMPAMVRGSFVATAALFAPPMILLGAVSPLLVTVLVRAEVPIGRAAGGVGAASTLGSLVGTFAATHWLVPMLGCRATLGLAGALAVFAGLAARRGGAVLPAVLVLAVVVGAAFGHSGPLRPAPGGRELLAERESPQQFLQVQRETPTDGPARTMLVVNEGLDSFHSLFVEGSSLTGGAYYDWHAVAPLLAGDGRRPGGLRVLSIGDAAGSLRTVYAGCHPGSTVDGVDIDPACGELGQTWFGTAKAPGGAFVADGRVFLERAQATWDVVHVDAYAHQVYVPAHLASREFFVAAKARLAANGVLACNVGALHGDDPVLRSIGGTLAGVFGHALALAIPQSRNWLLLARNGAPPAPASLATHEFEGERLGDADLQAWRRIVAAAARPEAWVSIPAASEPLVDDRPVLDHLLMASYVDRRDPGITLSCGGRMDVAGAEAAAFAHARTGRWSDVLQAIADSREASAYLRELAGDARWSLRQLASAVAEYEAALLVASDDPTRSRLRGKLEGARAQLAPITEAGDVARRNGWLAVVGVALFLALAFGLAASLRTVR